MACDAGFRSWLRIAKGQEMTRESNFNVREKSENYTLSKGKFISSWEVRENWNFKDIDLFVPKAERTILGHCHLSDDFLLNE